MILEIIKFHVPVALGGKTITTINLNNVNLNGGGRYLMKFESGLVKISDKDAKKGSNSVVYVGMNNVVYMSPKEDAEPVAKKPRAAKPKN